tara:strand:+ start:345 stop:956 length:612 start_codon:yes stop_codon:yes gene_type:complete
MIQDRYQRIAWAYDILDFPWEYWRYQSIRPHLFNGLKGTILDAGIGTGQNVNFYSKTANVIGIDLSRNMLKRAAQRCLKINNSVQLLEMNIIQSGFKDNTFDGVVSTFLFCVLNIEQQRGALSEIYRILKPGGELRIMDYNYSSLPINYFAMKISAPWAKFAYGAQFNRSISKKTLETESFEYLYSRWLFKDIIKMTVAKKPS